MRLIDADELKKHKYHSDITHENVVAVAQIDWMPTVCDIEQIKSKHDEMMKYSYSYGKKDVLEQMRAEVRQLTEYGRMGDSKFILDTDVLRIIDSYTK